MMTERDWVALATSWGRHATAEKRRRAAQFLGALTAEDEAMVDAANDDAERARRERLWEEGQLDGSDLARLRREPAA